MKNYWKQKSYNYTNKIYRGFQKFMGKAPVKEEMPFVFIIGITRRSGTNFLFNLLNHHPKVQSAFVSNEDHLFRYSQLLLDYIERTSACRRDNWDGMNKQQFKTQLTDVFGQALYNFLTPKTAYNKVILTKTPFTSGFQNIFTFFPKCKIIILLREGKNVVESGVQSGFWSYDEGMKHWRENARDIINFKQNYQNHNDNFKIIKYENLFKDTSRQLGELFDFCGIDKSDYDHSVIDKLSIIGSSQHKNTDGSIDWLPKKREAKFNPLDRSAHWDEKLTNLFYKYCLEEGLQLGYYEEKLQRVL